MILFFFYLFLISPLYCSGFIYTTVDIDFNKIYIRFYIFIDKFEGNLIKIFDLKYNHSVLEVARLKNNRKYVCSNFNNKKKYIPLIDLCGCDQCEDTLLYLQMQNDIFLCNSDDNVSAKKWKNGENDACLSHKKNIHYPQYYVNTSREVTIVMGNEETSTEKQMTGCVSLFYINGHERRWNKRNQDILPSCPRSCPRSCRENICNGGVCMPREYDMYCNCKSVSKNGRYCNKSLTTYTRSVFKSYQIFRGFHVENEIYLKLTWKQLSLETYCLLEIIGRKNHFVIHTNGSQIKGGSNAIGSFNNTVINFVSVTFHEEELKVKTLQNETSFPLSVVDIIRINVGFSEKYGNYETIEGLLYDVEIEPFKLREIEPKPLRRDTTTFSTRLTTKFSKATTTLKSSMSTTFSTAYVSLSSLTKTKSTITQKTTINSTESTYFNTTEQWWLSSTATIGFPMIKTVAYISVSLIVAISILLGICFVTVLFRKRTSMKYKISEIHQPTPAAISNNLKLFGSEGSMVSSDHSCVGTDLPNTPTLENRSNYAHDSSVYSNIDSDYSVSMPNECKRSNGLDSIGIYELETYLDYTMHDPNIIIRNVDNKSTSSINSLKSRKSDLNKKIMKVNQSDSIRKYKPNDDSMVDMKVNEYCNDDYDKYVLPISSDGTNLLMSMQPENEIKTLTGYDGNKISTISSFSPYNSLYNRSQMNDVQRASNNSDYKLSQH